MFSHICHGVNDFERALAFYQPLMDALNLKLNSCERDIRWASWRRQDAERPQFVICQPFNHQPARAGNGQMTAFLAENRAMVDRVYATAIAQGATCEGKPGLRPHYHEHYYGAYFRDPDGNKLHICCQKAE